MPRLKSAVNSFLLTKKRFKRRRKTNKRKRTNRRYKRWMRGGANLTKQQYDTFFGSLPDNEKIDVTDPKKDDKEKTIEKIIMKSLNGDTADTEPTEDNFKTLYAQHKGEDIDALIATLNSLETQPLPDTSGSSSKQTGGPDPGAANTAGVSRQATRLTIKYNDGKEIEYGLIKNGALAGGGRRRR